ncbi:MAG: phosphatase PAP2 family protein [Candidatus Bathyarchaeia archaeon]
MVKRKEDKKYKLELNFDYHSSRFFGVLFPALYLVAMTIFCVEYKIIPGPEFLILGILIYAGYNQRTWRVLKDWLPFLTVFISYEIMYSVIGTIAANSLNIGPYNWDMQLFGQIPSLTLQQTLTTPTLNYVGAFFYGIYFFVPTIFAYVLWKKSPKNYWKYIVAFGICTFSALITFLFYPVAPPWIAVPNVTRILTGSVDPSLGLPVYRTLFDFLSPNIYAAFPSMHSALPWLVFLFAFKTWKWKSLPVISIPVGTWFSAVYLGEHYFTDVLGGIAYATIAFIVAVKILPLLSARSDFLKRHVPV